MPGVGLPAARPAIQARTMALAETYILKSAALWISIAVMPPVQARPSSLASRATPRRAVRTAQIDAEKAFVQAYNGHIAVDSEHQIIVAVGLSNQAPDAEYFIPRLKRASRLSEETCILNRR